MHNDGQVITFHHPLCSRTIDSKVMNDLLLPWIGKHMGVAGSALHLDEQQGNMWFIRF